MSSVPVSENVIVGAASPAPHLARRLAAAGSVARVWDPDSALAAALAQSCGGRAEASLEALIGATGAPRILWLASDSAETSARHLDRLGGMLAPGDSVVETGEADFRVLPERARALAVQHIHCADLGLVAGDWGGSAGRLLAVGAAFPIPPAVSAALNVVAEVPKGVWIPCGPPGSARFVSMVAAEGRKSLEGGLAEGFETLGRVGMELQMGALVSAWQRSGERNAALGRLAKEYLEAIGWDSGGSGVPPGAVTLALSLRFAAQGLELYLAQLSALMGTAGPGAGAGSGSSG